MHRCLCVDEIIRLVAHELVVLPKGRATAASLACCCKSFEDPVLDALWATQSDILPLLRTLPDDIWNPGGHEVSATNTALVPHKLAQLFDLKCLKRPPTRQEWGRLQKYAQRMQTFRESLTMMCPLPSRVLSVLQFRSVNKPLLPNLKTLKLWSIRGDSISLIPSFLSTRTTTIELSFLRSDADLVAVASMITTFPTLCPNLQKIRLGDLPKDPVITSAVSELLLTSNRNVLRYLLVDSPLTEEAREVMFKHPDLRKLSTVVDGSTPLFTMVLPNLTEMVLEFNHERDWLQGFRGASLGKLVLVSFFSDSSSIGDFLEAFESVTLTTSIPATLSTFIFNTSRQWRPNYRSLLSFTRLVELTIDLSCEPSCSSRMDDDTVAELAQAMPKLETLRIGESPCKTPGGITIEGLSAIAPFSASYPFTFNWLASTRHTSLNFLSLANPLPCKWTAL